MYCRYRNYYDALIDVGGVALIARDCTFLVCIWRHFGISCTVGALGSQGSYDSSLVTWHVRGFIFAQCTFSLFTSYSLCIAAVLLEKELGRRDEKYSTRKSVLLN